MTRPFTRRQFGSKAPSRKSARASLRSLLRDCRIEKLASFTPDSEEWRSIVRSNSTPDAEADAMLAEVQAERLETRRAMLAAAKAQRGCESTCKELGQKSQFSAADGCNSPSQEIGQ